ncbi:MAG: fused response regulator/phosphatase [Acidobacteria bacterium]|nr:fused response regulator/phosphatase [Acidobacteriota bacterium]
MSVVRSAKDSSLILVVDDDPTIVYTISGLLRMSGFLTAEAGDVASALSSVYELKPDLVLLDVHLPDGSGFDLCRQLNSEGLCAGTPILFISANEDIRKKVEGFEAGGVDYITKPIVGAEVIARVRTHLRLRQAYEKLAHLQAERMSRLAVAQQNLMPSPEDVPDARFAACVRQVLPAGGDFYDVIQTGPHVVDYMVADASGHDLAASLWTGCLKALAVEYASLPNVPSQIMQSMNSSMCRLLPTGAFFTVIYARLNHQTGQLSLVNAGHTPAIVVHRDRDEVTSIRQPGDVLGAFNDAAFGRIEMKLKPGDRLFLYTDGLIDCRCSCDEGLRRLSDACVRLRALSLSSLVPQVVKEIRSGMSCPDDVLLMGIEL